MVDVVQEVVSEVNVGSAIIRCLVNKNEIKRILLFRVVVEWAEKRVENSFN